MNSTCLNYNYWITVKQSWKCNELSSIDANKLIFLKYTNLPSHIIYIYIYIYIYTCNSLHIYIYIYICIISSYCFNGFIVYSNWILFWHTVSVCWRDANILVLPRHQRLSIDFICICVCSCMYVYVYLHTCVCTCIDI